MTVLSYIIAASAPGFALLLYFYLKDRYVSEPISMVMRMFTFGVLVVFPTMVIQRGFVLSFGDNPFLFAFVWSGLIEESVKWLLVYHLIFSHSVFDEPYDGIVYAVAVSLGYATLENIIYTWHYSPSFSEMFLRALLPVSGHALFGVLMGYYFGRAKFTPALTKRYLTIAWFAPSIWHGLFDYIILTKTNYGVGIIGLMTILWYRSIRKVNKANDRSPYRTLSPDQEIKLSSNSQ
jgi:RsiW-degrading membrane proteinase PrsW (M82 family)